MLAVTANLAVRAGTRPSQAEKPLHGHALFPPMSTSQFYLVILFTQCLPLLSRGGRKTPSFLAFQHRLVEMKKTWEYSKCSVSLLIRLLMAQQLVRRSSTFTSFLIMKLTSCRPHPHLAPWLPEKRIAKYNRPFFFLFNASNLLIR